MTEHTARTNGIQALQGLPCFPARIHCINVDPCIDTRLGILRNQNKSTARQGDHSDNQSDPFAVGTAHKHNRNAYHADNHQTGNVLFQSDQGADHGNQPTGHQHAVNKAPPKLMTGGDFFFMFGHIKRQHHDNRHLGNFGGLNRDGADLQPPLCAASCTSDYKHQQ